jgi:predicted enzyme related to lactoylglutathione lyase
MSIELRHALFRKIDCFQIPVPDLETGLAFYCARLGLALNWRTSTSAGLRMPETDAEIVLQTERPELETDLLVDSADDAAQAVVEAGGSIVVPPFDIPVGRCVVVADPWGNHLVLLDLSKGLFVTDADGSVRRDSAGNLVVARPAGSTVHPNHAPVAQKRTRQSRDRE